MVTLRNQVLVQVGLVVACASTVGAPHMSLRPVRAVGSTYTVMGNTITVNQTPAHVLVEGYFGGWGMSGLTNYCQELEPLSFASGPGASLGPGRVPCSTNADCATALGITGNAPDLKCNDFVPGQCNYMFQDRSRPDFLTSFNIPGCNSDLYACGAATSNPPAPDTGMDRYNMTAVIHIPGGAFGTYEITLDEIDIDLTFFQVADGSVFAMDSFEHAFINVRPEDACVMGTSHGMPCSQHSDCPGGACHLKNRFISFVPSDISPTGGIQVTLVSLDPGSVMNPAAYNGTIRWVGPPTLGVNDTPNGTFNAAPLQCAFHSQDWTTAGRLHLYGSVIVPGSTYDVRLCETETGPCSAPLRIGTAKWGDVVPPLGTTNFIDINAVVAKHKFTAGCPNKSRAKLREPVVPSALVNALEIMDCVTAFQGMPYRVRNPAVPPTCP